MLESFAKDVWTDTRRCKFFGVETGSRMTIVKMRDGGLFVHSPVALDHDTRRDIDNLGEVRAVVAPSIFHHLHVAAWMEAYPKAVYGACPGLDRKRPDLPFQFIMGDEPHPAYAGDLQQVYFSTRRENEVVFFHEQSRTMICCDALLNLSEHDYRSTRFVAALMRNTAPGFGWMERFMIRDRKLARREVDRILDWDFDRIVLSHGATVPSDGREAMRRAYAWL
jgi:hypothetical protein